MINEKYMDLIKDEHKTSFTAYKIGRKLLAYSSHQPVLIHLLNTITEGDVLEYGVGWNSTPIMHTICGLQGRKLISVDTDRKWLDKFTHYKNPNHEFIYMSEKELCEWKHPLFKQKYAIAFIDGAPGEARNVFLNVIRDNVEYFVAHDTEEWVGKFTYPAFTYKWDFSYFKHQHHLRMGDPATSLLSNSDNFNEELLKVFQLWED